MDAPPMSALAIRFLLSGLIAVGIALTLGQTWRLTAAQRRATIIFGLCQNALYLGLNFIAMQWIEASLAAIIASTMPLLVAFASWVLFRERLPVMGTVGLIAGFGGVALIMSARLGQADINLFGVGLCVLGAMALTIATLSARSASSGGNVLMIVGLQMLVGSAALAVAAIFLESWQVNWTWRLAAAFTYTTFVPGLVATWVWFNLVNRIGATRAATFHFMNPFLGVAVAALLLGEALGARDILGVTIVALGILAVQLSKTFRKTSAAPSVGK